MSELLFLVLGFLLGLLGSVAFFHIQRLYARRDFLVVARRELSALRVKIAIVALKFRCYVGPVDDEFLKWLKPALEEETSNVRQPEALEHFRRIAALPVEQRTAALSDAAGPRVSSRPVPYRLFVVDPSSSAFLLGPKEFQLRLIEVADQLDFYRQDVAHLCSQLDLTFDSSLSQTNRGILENNIQRSYKALAKRSRWLVEAIQKCEETCRRR